MLKKMPFRQHALQIYFSIKKGTIRKYIFLIKSGHIIKYLRILKWLRSSESRYLQVGGGYHCIHRPGWLNGDIIAGDVYLDAKKKLPFPDNSLDAVFTEQFIEHISKEDGIHFIQEIYRVLKPSGILRQSTPDLQLLVHTYQDKNPYVSQHTVIQRHIRIHRSKIPDEDITACYFLNDMFRLWGHSFIYDQETLENTTKNAGFKNCNWVNFGKSQSADLNNLERHADEKWMEKALVMILEAEKPRPNPI